jgi:hypothetical protein
MGTEPTKPFLSGQLSPGRDPGEPFYRTDDEINKKQGQKKPEPPGGIEIEKAEQIEEAIKDRAVVSNILGGFFLLRDQGSDD